MTVEDFDKIISDAKKIQAEAEQKEAAAKKLYEDYLEVVKESKELSIEHKELEKESVTDLVLENLTKEVEVAKTEAGKKAAAEEKEKAEKAAAQLKKVGKLICDSVNTNINNIISDFAMLGIDQENNLEALNAFNNFVRLVDVQFVDMKKKLKQDEDIQA